MTKRHVLGLIAPIFLALVGFANADDPPATGTAPTTQDTAATPSTTATNPVVSRLVTMHLARVGAEQFSADQVEAQSIADVKVYATSYGDVERKQLHDNSAAIADSYIEYVNYKVSNSTTWPQDHTQASAMAELATLKTDAQKTDVDLLPILRRANEVLAWSLGKPSVTPDIDHFARHDELVAKTLAAVPDASKLTDAVAATPPTPDQAAATPDQAAGTQDQAAGTATTAPPDATASAPAEEDSPLATITSKVTTIYLVRLAVGETPATRVAESVVTDVKTISADYGEPQQTKLNEDLKTAANKYLDFVTERAKASTTWPSDRPASTYVGMAALMLSMIRDEVASADANSDLVGPLSRANRVLAWSNGLAEPSAELDHFAKHQTVVEYALGRAASFEQPKRPEDAPAQAPTGQTPQ